MLIPHHGSNTSSTQALIQQLKPQYAMISSGFHNRFNHPADTVLKRYRQNAIKVFNTASSGAIEVMINEQGNIKIRQWRREKKALWRRQGSKY